MKLSQKRVLSILAAAALTVCAAAAEYALVCAAACTDCLCGD